MHKLIQFSALIMLLISLIVIILILVRKAYINHGKPKPDVVCGGIVDSSFDAPKVITSKDLTAIDTEFFYTEADENRQYACLHITLRQNEKKELILSEEKRYGVNVKVSDAVLIGVQSLIDTFKLSALNGTVKYTAGLPAPHTPIYLKAEYASGESIYFCVKGNPQELWCNELAEYVLRVFKEYGETSILPKREP